MSRLKSAALTAALLAPALGQAQIPQCKDLDCIRDAVKKIAKASLEKKEFVGMSVVVVDRDNGSFDSHFGFQDLAKKIPASKHTIYELASITKPFTFLALALQDKVKLDDPISRYLPDGVRNPKPRGKDILVKHLLTHTSEIFSVPCVFLKLSPLEKRCFREPYDPADPYKNLTEEKFYKFIDASAEMYIKFPKVFAAPGFYREYSNMGAALIGEIVAKAHGISYDKLIETKILGPLKMTQSYIWQPCSSGQHCKNIAKVYTRDQKEESWRETPRWSSPAAKGAGGISSTPHDMEKFLRANMTPEKTPISAGLRLGQTMLADSTTAQNSNICKEGQDPRVQRCNPNKRDVYWAWVKSRSDPVFWHNGGAGGSQSMMQFAQDGSFGVVVLQNSDENDFDYADELGGCIMYIAGKRSRSFWCEKFEDAIK